MKATQSWVLTITAATLFSSPSFAQEEENAAPQLPSDLIEDPHVREELGINEFTAPSIRLIFDDLEQLAPLPVRETKHELPERMPLDRSDLSIEIGFLIAEGFLAVQNNTLDDIEGIAKELSRYGKALGAGERVNRHAASLLDHAKNDRPDELKTELAATQKDVEIELVQLRDADLAHLISFGGWIRALECASLAVEKNFTEERASQLFREDIADYYEQIIGSLDPRVSGRKHMVEIREICSGLKNDMTLASDEEPTEEKVKEIQEQSKKLAELALSRGQ
ncbi:hypothetical protein ACFPK9_13860 [Rubritalea spongiae]|uniref:Secreted protein n=1 Tax=Rubritalea spongiae TaxID=430797 RepID=A0ABW5E1R7_9BACT